MPPTSLTTFNGNSLNSSRYETGFKNPRDVPQATNVYIDQAKADSVPAGTYTVNQRDIYLSVRIKDGDYEELMRWFESGTRGPLVGPFDDGQDYQLDCSVVGVDPSPEDTSVYIVHLLRHETYWRAVDADAFAPWTPTGSGGSTSITVEGTAETRLSVTLTPTAAPTGIWLFQNVLQLINVPGIAIGYRSFCITLDTAALIASGYMNDDCGDVRLFDAGAPLNRWIANPNTASTNIFFNATLAAGQALTLSSGVLQVETATAVGTIGTAGNATVVVTATGMTGSPKTFNVAVAHLDTPAQWAAKVRAVLAADSAVTALYMVSGSAARIVLTRKAPANNDSALNISLANGTCTGITGAGTSANTQAGSLYSIDNFTDIPTLDFAVKPATRTAINALPTKFILQRTNGSGDTEWFACQKTASSPTTCKVNVLRRGAYGTTKITHSGGDVFYWVEHPIVMYAGNDQASDPTTAAGYNNTKPVFSLSGSDGTLESVTTSDLFFDPTLPNRPGSWTKINSRHGNKSYPYSITGDAASGNPALGCKAGAYGPPWQADIVTIGWMKFDPRGFRRITCTGRKYRSGASWPGTAKLQCSPDGSIWTDVFSEATPPSVATYASFAAHTNVDLPAGSKFLRLILSGSSGNVQNSYQLFEALTFIAYYTTANIPSLTLLGWQSNYYLDVRLTNSYTLDGVTHSNYIELNFAMLQNKDMVLDGELREIEYDDVNAHSALTLDDESRSVWLPAGPGTNTVTIASVEGQSIGTLGVALSACRRRS